MRKLLIVDDSEDLLEVLEYFLVKKGYHVTTLSHAGKVIETVKAVQPDLIILDVFIGGKDGREVCRLLRANILTKYLCIMLFSASPEAIKSFDQYGADGCIEKPFALTDIIEKIEGVFDKCKGYKYN